MLKTSRETCSSPLSQDEIDEILDQSEIAWQSIQLIRGKHQPKILIELYLHGPLRPTELDDAFDTLHGKVRRQSIEPMIEWGLVEREEINPSKAFYTLTDAGVDMVITFAMFIILFGGEDSD